MATEVVLRCVLPVSGRTVALRQPTGRDELLLLEHRGSEAGRAIALADALAGDAVAASLPVTDLDVLLLRLRQVLTGDRIVAESSCPAPGCGARVDIRFGIGAYLAHHAPRQPAWRQWRQWRRGAADNAAGWIALNRGDATVRFRLPTAGDERDAAEAQDAAALLAERCLAPQPYPAMARRITEAAMAAMAPPMSGPIAGACPQCGAAVAVRFDPRRYVLSELRDRARFVAAELHTLAKHYRWSERAILALPSQRRAIYADMARSAA